MKSDRLYSVVLNRSKSSRSHLSHYHGIIWIRSPGQARDPRGDTSRPRAGSQAQAQGNNRISATEMGCYYQPWHHDNLIMTIAMILHWGPIYIIHWVDSNISRSASHSTQCQWMTAKIGFQFRKLEELFVSCVYHYRLYYKSQIKISIQSFTNIWNICFMDMTYLMVLQTENLQIVPQKSIYYKAW